MKILFAGESWMISTSHIKGADIFPSQSYDESTSDRIREICKDAGFEFDFMPSHKALRDFPGLEGLRKYDLVVLSDIGSDTLYFHPDTVTHFKVHENRIKSLCEYVKEGGGLIMFGGWNSFQGSGCRARYGFTPLADVLPIRMYPYDDRNETPEGAYMEIVAPEHPMFKDVNMNWAPFLGYNRLMPKDGAEILAKCGDDVLIAVEDIGNGKTCAYASDITTHWAPDNITHTDDYARFIENMFNYIARK